MMRTQNGFQALINSILASRGWSQRELARQLDVSVSTVSRTLDEQNPSKPDIKLLTRLSKLFNIQLETLITLAYPDEAFMSGSLSGDGRLLAERFEKLPKNVQQAIMSIIRERIGDE